MRCSRRIDAGETRARPVAKSDGRYEAGKRAIRGQGRVEHREVIESIAIDVSSLDRMTERRGNQPRARTARHRIGEGYCAGTVEAPVDENGLRRNDLVGGRIVVLAHDIRQTVAIDVAKGEMACGGTIDRRSGKAFRVRRRPYGARCPKAPAYVPHEADDSQSGT
jgi:hypothetical protein